MKHAGLFCAASFFCLVMGARAQVSMYLAKELPVETSEITAISFSDDSRLTVAGTADGPVYVWNTEAGELLHRLEFHKKAVRAAVLGVDAKYLTAASDDGKISIWDLESGALTNALSDFKGKPASVCLSPDGRLLAAGGGSREICLWEFPSGFFKGKLEGHKKDVIHVAFGADNDELISVGKDKRIIWWDVNRQVAIRQIDIAVHTLPNSGNDIVAATSSTDGRLVAVGVDEQVLEKGGRGMKFRYQVAFFDWSDGSLVKVLEDNQKSVSLLELTPHNCYIVLDNSTLQLNTLSFRNTSSGRIDYEYELKGPIQQCAVAVDGDWLAVATADAESRRSSRLGLWELTVDAPATTCLGSRFTVTTPESPLIESGGPYVIAVLPFGSADESDNLGESVPRFLESKLVSSPQVRIVERSKIDEVIKELEFQKSGYTEQQAAEIGRILGAQYLITGSVDELGHDKIISAKLIDTETSEILGIREVHCKACSLEEIFEAVALLAPTIAAF
jgi:WD40 repeat protein